MLLVTFHIHGEHAYILYAFFITMIGFDNVYVHVHVYVFIYMFVSHSHIGDNICKN